MIITVKRLRKRVQLSHCGKILGGWVPGDNAPHHYVVDSFMQNVNDGEEARRILKRYGFNKRRQKQPNGQFRYWWRLPITAKTSFDVAIREITGAELPENWRVKN